MSEWLKETGCKPVGYAYAGSNPAPPTHAFSLDDPAAPAGGSDTVRRVVDDEVIAEAGRTLARAARSPARVILFGSRARGTGAPDSDLDFLVIEEKVDSKVDEMVRLRDALPPLGVPVDVLVVSQADVDGWGRRERDDGACGAL